MCDDFIFLADDEAATDRFGAVLAKVLTPGAVIALNGTLGAGKTRLVQAIGKALGLNPREVISPTFVLLHEYIVPATLSTVAQAHAAIANPRPTKIFHFDAYRLKDDDEFLALGPDEYFESDGWTIIEWADRVAACLPRDYLRIDIEIRGQTEREIRIRAVGEQYIAIVEKLGMNCEW